MANLANIPAPPKPPLSIGLSQCLTGDMVRYDGTGARSSLPHQDLDRLFEYRSFCPEVGIGMSVPRDPIQLVGTVDDYSVRGIKDPSVDKTDDLASYAYRQLPSIDELMGYIFMHKSPSCGLHTVKLYASVDGCVRGQASGAYAAVIAKQRPLLPVQNANRLFDVKARESFVLATFIYAHWQLMKPEINRVRLLAFHQHYKPRLDVLNHPVCLDAERILHQSNQDIALVAQNYFDALMDGLNRPIDH